jgi:hypothetical protein
MAALETFRRSELERRIEEMIALLDLLDDDADIEDGHDDEPTLGAENDHEGRSQEIWAQASRLDECEAEDEHGGDIQDERHDGEGDEEPELGRLECMDQRQAYSGHGTLGVLDGEPDLGWIGHGTGWAEGEPVHNREEGSTLHHADGIPEGQFDGLGAIMAGDLLARAKTRREPYAEIIGTRHHRLHDGSVFTTLVPR